MMQVAMFCLLLAGYPQMNQKKKTHTAVVWACAADHGSAARSQMTWFIPCLEAVAVTALSDGLP